MRRAAKGLLGMTALGTLFSLSLMAQPVMAADNAASVAEGKKLAFDRKKGNCLACHQIEDGTSPGNVGPPLMMMNVRFADRNRLRAQLDDPTQFNANTMMPPFGRHKILSGDEIEKIVDYLLTL